MYPRLERYLDGASEDFDQVREERRESLEKIARFIESPPAPAANLVFICTHNSRRSHMAQLFAAAARRRFGLEGVRTFSGGTEITAFEPRAAAAIERTGFRVTQADAGRNPVYLVRLDDDESPIRCFSKTFDDPQNPGRDFAAVMTCSAADEACPIVTGASIRVVVPYEDPKAADGAPEEAATYDERCREIATEMLFAFSLVRA